MLCHTRQPKALHLHLGIQSPSTSGLALGASFPAVPTEALPVAPPVAVPTPPGFVAMVDPDDAVWNAPGVEKSII